MFMQFFKGKLIALKTDFEFMMVACFAINMRPSAKNIFGFLIAVVFCIAVLAFIENTEDLL